MPEPTSPSDQQAAAPDRRQVTIGAAIAIAGIGANLAPANADAQTKKKGTSVSRTPLDVVKTFLAGMEKLDYDNALKLVHPDCEYLNGPLPKVRGPAGVRATLEPFFKPTIENEFLILRESSAGPVVFVERLDRHRLASGWVELPVTGVFEVHDGLITYWSDYFDLETIRSKWPAPG